MPEQICMPVTDASQVGVVRRTASRLAAAAGLSAAKCSDAAIVATELASNLLRHAVKGRVFAQQLSSPAGVCLELLGVDAGPGIADLRRAMQDGYSSGGTAGTGFGAIRRLSDEFDAFSTVGRGTVVMSRIRKPGGAERPDAYLVGAMSHPAPGETICGDSWRAVEQDGQMAIMVADGLGHGPLASEAAERVAALFESRPFAPSPTFYADAHRALIGSRGAAVARAVVDRSGRIEYSGVGNIAGSLVHPQGSRGLPSQNGTVGAEVRRSIASQQYEWPAHGVLLMHSDGLVSRWSLDPYPGILVRHPALVAAVLQRDFPRGRDDATVVVLRRQSIAQAAYDH